MIESPTISIRRAGAACPNVFIHDMFFQAAEGAMQGRAMCDVLIDTKIMPPEAEVMLRVAEKSGSYLHPQQEITEFLVIGLAKHIDEVGRPLCPCNFYEDKAEEAKSSTWICACEEMQKYKYCH